MSHYFDSDPTKLVAGLRTDGKMPAAFIADTTTANAQVGTAPLNPLDAMQLLTWWAEAGCTACMHLPKHDRHRMNLWMPPAASLQVRTLGETVRLDARTKLLNPKW